MKIFLDVNKSDKLFSNDGNYHEALSAEAAREDHPVQVQHVRAVKKKGKPDEEIAREAILKEWYKILEKYISQFMSYIKNRVYKAKKSQKIHIWNL